MNYYNEYDAKTAAWLRSLILAGAIPDGHVDERSIADVHPSDLRGYTQCHFFAGIGGWSYALQLAGWPSNRPVWTGSCPCQPFSTAGKGLAQADERHLWPVFFDLIRQCHPEQVFGEQVASAIGHGWLDGVSADLEAEGYACGATVLGAHSVGAPHIRQRLYWVANTHNAGPQRRNSKKLREYPNQCTSGESGSPDGLVFPDRDGCGQGRSSATTAGYGNPADAADSRADWLGNSDGCDQQPPSPRFVQHRFSAGSGNGVRTQGVEELAKGFWSDFQLIHCRDGKARRIPTQPSFFPLAHGIPARVVRLRGYGNAIVPECAKIFIEAFLDIQK